MEGLNKPIKVSDYGKGGMNRSADILKKVCHSGLRVKGRSFEQCDWQEDDAPVTSHVLSALQSDGWACESKRTGGLCWGQFYRQ